MGIPVIPPCPLVNFNPRTPRGVRRRYVCSGLDPMGISIHAPREGCDSYGSIGVSSWVNFNPRTPRGVRHIPARPVIEPAIISIHAPREGCDWALSGEGACITPFQSTHPARGATFSNCIQLESFVFQSTHPARGATPDIILGNMPVCISIHAPREGCDLVYSTTLTPPYIFQSTHPARGATRPLLSLYQLLVFQSTHPARGATFHFQLIKSTHGNFNPRTPRGVRLGT